MKTALLLFISIIFSSPVFSQIQRIKTGDYKFAKGEIELSFVDTVSREYAEFKVAKAGYEILSSHIRPITFVLRIKKEELDIKVLESNPVVNFVMFEPNTSDSVAVEEMIIRQKMNKEEAEKARERFKSFNEKHWVRIYMNYWVTEELAMEFMDENKDLNLQIPQIIPRTAIVKTIPGKENEAMRQLKKLDIVESVAFIALIDE
ncbi:MAG: hypothetical protein ABJR05_17160 [Balneola sp.]